MMAYTRNFHPLACIPIVLVAVVCAVQLGMASLAAAAAHSGTKPPLEEPSPAAGNVPGHSLGNVSDSEIWRAARRGLRGQVSIPDKQAGVLIQSEGEEWRAIRNGPVSVNGVRALVGVTGIVILYFVLFGTIRVEAGPSGRMVERFGNIERFAHWLTATSFIVLALTGLNLLYGRYFLIPVLGPEVFAAVARWGKYAHDFLAFAFMAGLVIMFLVWVRENLPRKHDLVWLARGGGMIVRHVHAPAGKFNAGEKVIFWLVMLGGLSLSLSGVSLLFPFEFAIFGGSFAFLNGFGLDLPADLGPTHEMQLTQLWHSVTALVLTAVLIVHMYLGSIGMEGAFDAMATGRVDENWAREHHDLWAAELETNTSSAEPGHEPG